MTTYRLFPSTNGPALTATTGGWLLGTIFSPTGGVKWFTGWYQWVPTGGDLTARKCALWTQWGTGSNQTLVSGSVVTSGTLSATPAGGESGGHWNFIPLPTPIQLSPAALYVAATGYTATNGIPVASNQFGSGDTYAAGIVNGPLTAWSATSGSNTFPAGTVNYGLGQQLFSNSLGADPSAAMPNNGSSSDFLGVDVQISDTAPAAYAGSYRMRPNQIDLGNYNLDTANNFTLGVEFISSQAAAVNKIWFYSPATVTQLPTSVGIFAVSGPSLVASSSSPSWSGAAGSGWVSSTALAGTVLSPGVKYKAAVLNAAGSPAIWNAAVPNYWSTGFGGAGLTAGPLTFYSNAAADSPGQATYNAGATLTYPATNAGPYDYGVDIEATPEASGSGLLMAAFP